MNKFFKIFFLVYLLLFFSIKLYENISKNVKNKEECTAVIVTGTHAKDGRSILMKNRDMSDNQYQKPTYHASYEDGNYSYVFINFMGMSESGLATMNTAQSGTLINWQYSYHGTYDAWPAMEYILSHFSDVEEAVSWLIRNGTGTTCIGVIGSNSSIGAFVWVNGDHKAVTWVNNSHNAAANNWVPDGVYGSRGQRAKTLLDKFYSENGYISWEEVMQEISKDQNDQEKTNNNCYSYSGNICNSATWANMVAVSGDKKYDGRLNVMWSNYGENAQIGLYLPLMPGVIDSTSDIPNIFRDGNGMGGLVEIKRNYARDGCSSGQWNGTRVREIHKYSLFAENYTFKKYDELTDNIPSGLSYNDLKTLLKNYVNDSVTIATNIYVSENTNPSSTSTTTTTTTTASTTTSTILTTSTTRLTTTTTASTTTIPSSSDLVLYHKFDEGSGKITYDTSYYKNNGNLYGGLDNTGWTTECKSEKCLLFDGVDDYIEIPHSNSISGFTNGLTVSFWIKPNDITRRQAILNKYNNVNGQKSWFIDGPSYPGNDLGFYVSQDGTNYVEWHANYAPKIGTWYYITLVWQSNAILKFYINAQVVSTIGTAIISQIYNNVGVPLYIGKSQYDSSRNFKGTIDEVKIWNKALTIEEIANEYETATQKSITIDTSSIIDTNNLRLGIQTDWDRWFGFIKYPARSQLAQDANIKIIRVFDFRKTNPYLIPCDNWNETIKNCNRWNWTNVDSFVSKMFEIGAEPLFALGYARDNIQNYIPSGMVVNPATSLPYPDSYAAYASEWVKHFNQIGQSVRFYEIMNEPWSYFDWNNYTKLANFMALFNAASQKMKAENPNVLLGFDGTNRKPVFDYWLSNGGDDIGFISFHKYDSGKIGYYTDDQMLSRAETLQLETSSSYYGIKDVRQTYYNNRGKWIPVINSESNFNSAWENSTDPKMQNIVGATWLALVLRSEILNSLDYHIYFEFSSSKSWEQANKPPGYGFGIINSDNNQPWYPYYVYKWIGNNLAVGDSIVNSTSSSDYIRSLAWINNGRLNIFLINKLNLTRTFSLQGVTSQLNYYKIDDPSGTSYLNPIVQTGTVEAGDVIIMNGYTVMLLQSTSTATTSTIPTTSSTISGVTTTISPGEPGGSNEPGTTTTIPIEEPFLTYSMPTSFYVEENETKEFEVKLTNPSNVTLHNITIDIIGISRISYSLSPNIIDSLEANKSVYFIVLIDTKNIIPGSYTLKINITSKETYKETTLNLKVGEKSTIITNDTTTIIPFEEEKKMRATIDVIKILSTIAGVMVVTMILIYIRLTKKPIKSSQIIEKGDEEIRY